MNAKRKLLAAALIAVTAGLGLGTAPAHADDQSSDLRQIIRQEDSPLRAMAVEKLITLSFSPAWWQYMLNRDNKGYHTITNLADALMVCGVNLGSDDPVTLDESRDATSPLVVDAMAKEQSKVHCTISVPDDVKDEVKLKVLENLAMFGQPIMEKYYCKPRGGKMHLFLTVDAKAKALKFQISKDGNEYHFTVPAYIDLSTSPIEEALKQGT